MMCSASMWRRFCMMKSLSRRGTSAYAVDARTPARSFVASNLRALAQGMSEQIFLGVLAQRSLDSYTMGRIEQSARAVLQTRVHSPPPAAVDAGHLWMMESGKAGRIDAGVGRRGGRTWCRRLQWAPATGR